MQQFAHDDDEIAFKLADASGQRLQFVDRTGFALHKAKPKYAKIQDTWVCA